MGRYAPTIALECVLAGVVPGVLALPLTRGYHAIIDAEDHPVVLRLSATWQALITAGHIYAKARVRDDQGYRDLLLHRVLLGLEAGQRIRADHVNRDGLDNRRCNLREATPTQNLANQRDRPSTSSYKGVSFCSMTGRWRAVISVHGRYLALGRFGDERAAAVAYDTTARRIYGAFARVNLPLGDEQPAIIEGDPAAPVRRELGTAVATPRRGSHAGSSSRFKGVTYRASRRCYEASIKVGKRSRYLGQFASEEEAARAYDAAAIAAWGQSARLNQAQPPFGS